jgi:opacity protein-like surface antigen
MAMVVGFCLALIFVTVFSPRKAHADDSWTGFGAGVHGGLMDAAIAPTSSPIEIGSTGQFVGGSAFGNYQMGSMVIGAFVDYDRALGDLKTLGLVDFWTVGGRVGFLPVSNTLLYSHSGWSRFNVDGLGHLNGWNLGAGIEVKIAKNASIDMRYTHTWLDVKDVAGPGVDARGDSIRIGLNLALYKEGKVSIFDDGPAPVSKACDPKMANCRK